MPQPPLTQQRPRALGVRTSAAASRDGAAFDRCSDEHLMLLVKHGDVRAFEMLIKRHRVAVTSLARHVAGVDLADDVAQAAFVALWRHRGQYRAERGTPRSWLLTIVRHRAIDQLRSRTARQSHTMCMDPEGWIGIADEGPSAEPAHVHVERSESRAAIRRLLATLPPEQRGVVELSYFGGLSQQEIANRLEIPLGTVKGRLRLALQKLRAGWDQGEDARPDRMLAAA